MTEEKKPNCHTTNHKQPIWSDRKIDEKANGQGFRTAVAVVIKVPCRKKLLFEILYFHKNTDKTIRRQT